VDNSCPVPPVIKIKIAVLGIMSVPRTNLGTAIACLCPLSLEHLFLRMTTVWTIFNQIGGFNLSSLGLGLGLNKKR